tara:strand:- start:159 stop:488 length:330 start_codon:yes stop_codon:yes gene_type:complete
MYLSTTRGYDFTRHDLATPAWRAYLKIGAQIREIEDKLKELTDGTITSDDAEETAELKRELLGSQVILTDQYIRELTAALSRLLVEITDGPVTDLVEDRRTQEDEEVAS